MYMRWRLRLGTTLHLVRDSILQEVRTVTDCWRMNLLTWCSRGAGTRDEQAVTAELFNVQAICIT